MYKNSPLKVILMLQAVLLLLIFIYPLYGIILVLMGYYVNILPEELARNLIQEKKPITDCLLWRKHDIWPGPSTNEKQTRCVREYAQLVASAPVCEPLLSMGFGLSCLSEVKQKIFSERHCYELDGRDQLYCSRASEDGEITIEHPQIRDCSTYEREDVRDWCYLIKTNSLVEIYECEKIRQESTRDECEADFAFKQRNIAHCSKVKNSERQKYCEVLIDAWLNYPELQQSPFFGDI